jgi:hypothetical protein
VLLYLHYTHSNKGERNATSREKASAPPAGITRHQHFRAGCKQGAPHVNLFDPSRPRTAGDPALLCGLPATRLQVTPLGNGNVEIAAWLPVAAPEGRSSFETMRFIAVVPKHEIVRVLTNYETDPETELERLFDDPLAPLRPNVRDLRTRPSSSNAGAVTADEIAI